MLTGRGKRAFKPNGLFAMQMKRGRTLYLKPNGLFSGLKGGQRNIGRIPHMSQSHNLTVTPPTCRPSRLVWSFPTNIVNQSKNINRITPTDHMTSLRTKA